MQIIHANQRFQQLFQDHLKCQNDKEFLLGPTSVSIPGTNGHLLCTLFYHHQ